MPLSHRRRRSDLKQLRLPKFQTSFHGSPRTYQTRFHGSPQIFKQNFKWGNGAPGTKKIYQDYWQIWRSKYLKSDLLRERYILSMHTYALKYALSMRTNALKNVLSIHTNALKNALNMHTNALKYVLNMHTNAFEYVLSMHTQECAPDSMHMGWLRFEGALKILGLFCKRAP